MTTIEADHPAVLASRRLGPRSDEPAWWRPVVAATVLLVALAAVAVALIVSLSASQYGPRIACLERENRIMREIMVGRSLSSDLPPTACAG